MLISFLMLTIDRFETTPRVFQSNLRNADPGRYNIETLICDNGSKDKRIIEYFARSDEAQRMRITYHRKNSKNEGVSHSFNQLFLRSRGDVICFLGNDIEMPEGWLKEALFYIERVKDCGIVGFDWGHGGIPEVSVRDGIKARWLDPVKNRVFGSWVVHRRVIDKVGLFHEGYGPYGIEDSDFNERVNRAGFNSLYHPTLKSNHVCWDTTEKTPYRKMKDDSLSANAGIFGERLKHFTTPESLVEPLPPLRDPI